MRDHFKGNHRDQMFLLPPSVKDWLPAGDLAWFLMDAVGQMKLSGFYARYRSDGKGQAAFEPAMRVKRLEREASEAVQKHAGKVAAREKAELDSGKKPRGRKPQEPDAAPTAERSANVTDPDSRIMKTRRGDVQGCNGQSVVTEEQIIVAAELTMEENDVRQLQPMVAKMEETLAAVHGEKKESVDVRLADAGYCSEANLAAADPAGPEYIIATRKRWKQRQALREAPPPRGRIPMGLSHRERMDRKLRTRRGRALYRKRGQTVEPVFGQIKTIRGCDRFMRTISCVSSSSAMITRDPG
jgi:hypothetical protein